MEAWPASGRVLWALLSITVGAYVGTAVIAGLLFFFFNPAGAGDCSFNISVIALTLALGLLVSAVSMSPYVSCPDPLCRPQVPASQAGCGQPFRTVPNTFPLFACLGVHVSVAYVQMRKMAASLQHCSKARVRAPVPYFGNV